MVARTETPSCFSQVDFIQQSLASAKEHRYRQQIVIPVLISLMLVVARQPAEAQQTTPHTQPPICYAPDGLIDLETCTTPFYNIPKDELQKFYDNYGELVPGLPTPAVHNLSVGPYAAGNLTYMSQDSIYQLPTKAKEWGNLDPSKFVGVFASDSCAYMGGAAFIRREGSDDEWIGPLLIIDCDADVDQFGRACNVGTVGEPNYAVYSLFQKNGLLHGMEVAFKPTTDLTPPPTQVAPDQFVPYAQTWLKAGNYSCKVPRKSRLLTNQPSVLIRRPSELRTVFVRSMVNVEP